MVLRDRSTIWRAVAREANRVPDESVDALWRTLNYLCAAQLYLRTNVALAKGLVVQDVKPTPSGHWGVCPPVNMMLAALAPFVRHAPTETRISLILGAGHAGPSLLAYLYLTGELGDRWPEFQQGTAGLTRLVAGFPHENTIGNEITPLLPGQIYMGGQIGPAFSVACGTVLDRPLCLAIPLIGDGECETGATAAAWMGARALRASGNHGNVLPVVLLNGLRMGGRSLLGEMNQSERMMYFSGFGYRPIICDGSSIASARAALSSAVRGALSPGDNGGTVLVLTLDKGATGPEAVAGKQILGTARVHKAPLKDPRNNPEEFSALRTWLASYRPEDLLTRDGRPTPEVEAALPERQGSRRSIFHDTGNRAHATLGARATARRSERQSFGEAISNVLIRHAKAGDFRVFSPDELLSNRLLFDGGAVTPWVVEVLNEELCHGWLQGYIESGGRGIFISYEAFATVNTSLVHQYLKHLSLRKEARYESKWSLNYLLTSLGWNNCYSHQDPGLLSSIIDREDPSVRIFTPADAPRAAAVLDLMLRSRDQFNILVSSKHALPEYPQDTLEVELRNGIAIWPDAYDAGEPDIVLAAAGDIAVRQVTRALPEIQNRLANRHVRFVCINELTALGDPRILPHALSPCEFAAIFGQACPVVLAVPGFIGAVRGSIASRTGIAGRFSLLGYRDPGRPLSPEALLTYCGLDSHSLTQLSKALVE